MHICTQFLCQMSVKPGCRIRRELESDTWSQEGGHHWKTLNSAAQNWTKPHKNGQNRTKLEKPHKNGQNRTKRHTTGHNCKKLNSTEITLSRNTTLGLHCQVSMSVGSKNLSFIVLQRSKDVNWDLVGKILLFLDMSVFWQKLIFNEYWGSQKAILYWLINKSILEILTAKMFPPMLHQ